MKICYIAGDGPHTKHWVEHFADIGHEVHLITPTASSFPGVMVHKIGDVAPKSAVVGKLLEVRRIVQKISPDVVHAHQTTPFGVYGALSGFHPLVVSSWGSDIATIPDKSLVHRALTRFVIGRADVVHVQDPLCERRISDIGASAKAIAVIPWGVDLPTPQRNTPRTGKKVVMIVGGGSRNVDMVIKLVSEISTCVKDDIIIRVVGYNVIPPELSTFDNIEFIGRVPISTIFQLLKESDIYIDPYAPAHSDEIGHTYGMSLLEAMAHGIPTIAANRPTITHLPGWYHGEVFDAYGDETGISDKVNTILTDDYRRSEIIENNTKSIQASFIWDRNMARVEELYDSLV